MSEVIEFAVLTKSSKWHNLCVAGIDWNTGKFVRLVTIDDEIHGAVPESDFCYKDGSNVECLDLIRVSVLSNEENKLQPENFICDFQNKKIEFIKKVSLKEVLEKHPVDSDETIFKNIQDDKDVYGRSRDEKNDRLEEIDVIEVGKSLLLVKIDKLVLNENSDSITGKIKRSKATFKYKNKNYKLTVTDPLYEYKDGMYNDLYVVISIGTKFEEYYYKLIAAIYEPSMLLNESKYEGMINPEGISEGDSVNLTTLVSNINAFLGKNSKKKIFVKDVINTLVEKGFLYKKDKKSRIDTKGFASGIFYKNAFTKKGEAYRGIFYNRNIQAVILDFIDILTEEDKEYILNNQ